LLAQILGQLGAVGIASYLRSLADAADSGSIYLDDLTSAELRSACAAVVSMHMQLMQALGKEAKVAPRLSDRFNDAGGAR